MAPPLADGTNPHLKKETSEKIIAALNQHVADTTDLYLQCKHAHWNVKGMQAVSLHKLFDELADELREQIDEMAERATALGGTALGMIRVVAAASRLPDYRPLAGGGSLQHVDALRTSFAALAATTRAAIDFAAAAGDAVTADVFTGVTRSLDKSRWLLDAHAEG